MRHLTNMPTDKEKEAYKQGYIDGIHTYAYMKDGVYYVGTTGRTLKTAVEKVEDNYNFNPEFRRD